MRTTLTLTILSSLFIISSQITAVAQYPDWAQFNKGDEVHAFADEGNILWIGTSVGLVEYNKTARTSTVFNNANSPLPYNRVWTIAIDNNGVKWIGTLGEGIASFDGSSWTVYDTENSGLIDNFVVNIAIDDNFNKWIATLNGLSVFNGTDWTTYNSTNSDLPDNELRDILIDDENVVWIATANSGLVRYDGSSWTTFNTGNSDIPDNFIHSLEIDANNDLWIATLNAGLVKYDGTNWTTYNIDNSDIPENEIRSIAIDSLGNKWIGTGASGVAMFDDTNWIYYNESNSGLPDDFFITAILVDENNIKYFGTFEGGAVQLDDDNWSMLNISNSEIPHNGVNVVEVDSNNTIWLGTSNGLARIDGTGWTIYNTTNSSLPSNNINALTVITPDSVLVGTTGGLAVFNGMDWEVYNTDNSDIPLNEVVDIAVDTNGVIWLALSSGITSFDGTNWVSYQDEEPIGIFPFYEVEVETQNNTVWFGSDIQGLVKFDGGEFSYENSELPRNNVTSLHIDQNGTKWIGIQGSGLIVYNNTNWITYNTSNSDLPDNNVTSTVVDSDGIAWIGTYSGLSKLDGTTWTNYYRTNSGLPVDGVTDVAIDTNNTKWIATLGIVAFNETGLIPDDAGIISGIEEVCEGSCEVTYTVEPIDKATSYQWILPEGATGNSNTNTIRVCYSIDSKSGNIYVTGVNEFGEGEPSSLLITLKPRPDKPTVTQTANVLRSSANEGNQWFNLSGAIPGATSQTFTVNETGDYYVVVSLSGCSSVPSDTVNMIITSSTGYDQKDFIIHPNPVTDILIVEKMNSNSIIYYEVITLNGELIDKGSFNGKKNISTKNLSPGFYILKTSSDKEVSNWKFIKK